MYNGIGLQTVRGSGTNGYVQTNKAYVKAINVRTATELNAGGMNKEESWKEHTRGQGNAEILEHSRKRRIEAKVFALRDEMEDAGASEELIDHHCDRLRAELIKVSEGPRADFISKIKAGLDSHEASAARERNDARLRDAFGIDQKSFVEGAAFDRDLQEQKRLERAAERDQRDTDEQRAQLAREKAKDKAARDNERRELERRERELERREQELTRKERERAEADEHAAARRRGDAEPTEKPGNAEKPAALANKAASSSSSSPEPDPKRKRQTAAKADDDDDDKLRATKTKPARDDKPAAPQTRKPAHADEDRRAPPPKNNTRKRRSSSSSSSSSSR